MVDAWTAVLTGLFTGIGVETAKVVHDLYIKKHIEEIDQTMRTAVKERKVEIKFK